MAERVVATFHGDSYNAAKQDDSHLAKQSFDDLADLSQLHPLMKEFMSRQATVNVGTIGHVAHGKSTLVNAVSGVKPQRFKRELVNNITIKLGYANAKVFKCPKCPAPDCFSSGRSNSADDPTCKHCEGKMELVRHFSFVDCPGHEILMATMLNGAAVMDAALLIIAANENCPQPQTSEHLAAIEMVKLSLNHLIICQNKCDLVKEEVARQQLSQITDFVRGTTAEFAPIIPMSAQMGYNVDALLEALVRIPPPTRDFVSPPLLVVIRSFDVNKPGEEVEHLQGGVAGGTIVKGVLRVGQKVEVLPGVVVRRANEPVRSTAVRTVVRSLQAEENTLLYAVPGGLIGVGTNIDPTITRGDRLVGNVIGQEGQLPPVWVEIEVKFVLLRTLFGVKDRAGSSRPAKIDPIKREEMLCLNIGSMNTGGRVVAVQNEPFNRCKIVLYNPVCTELQSKVAISRKIDRNWRLIGWGSVTSGATMEEAARAAAEEAKRQREAALAGASAAAGAAASS